jgi:hypothetical protein
MKELWASNTGHVVCRDHGGGYFETHLRVHPRARKFVTPLAVWQKMTSAEVEEWLELFGEPGCESCPATVSA